MPPNVALTLCFVRGVPAVVDCLTTGIILALEKPKNHLENQSLGTKSRKPPLLWLSFY